MKVPSSERLLALIDESKRLLESRTVNEIKNEDRINRIVLHQPTNTTQTRTVELKDYATENKDLFSKLNNNNEKNTSK